MNFYPLVDHSLFKYNIIFNNEEITPSDVSSSVNPKSSIVLDSLTCYSNNFPPRDGNHFLESKVAFVSPLPFLICVFKLSMI